MAKKGVKIWDRQQAEPSKWYDRFVFYLELGPERTLERAFSNWWDATNAIAARKRGKPKGPPNTWYDACRDRDWRGRCAAWDDENRRARLEEQAKAQQDMIERHLKTAMALQQIGVATLQDLIAKARDKSAKGLLTAREAAAYIEQGIKLERQARGFPADMLQLSVLTDEELISKYSEILSRLSSDDVAVGDPAPDGDADIDIDVEDVGE